jgi:hypothetical protein
MADEAPPEIDPQDAADFFADVAHGLTLVNRLLDRV